MILILFKFGLKNLRAYVGFLELRKFMRKVKLKFSNLLFPVMFSITASCFEAVSLLALTPFLKGFLEQDYGFVRDWVWYERLMVILPEALRQRNSTAFVLLLGAVVVSVVLKSIMIYLSFISLCYQGRRLSDNIRRTLLGRYFLFGKQYFDKTSMGHMLQAVMTHPVRIMSSLNEVNSALNCTFLVIVYVASLFVLSWQLTLIILMLFPVFYISMSWIVQKIKKSSETDVQARTRLNNKTVNILSGMPLIESNCNQAEEMKSYHQLSFQQRLTEYSIDKKTYFITPLTEVMNIVAMVFILVAMSFLIVKQQAGTVAAYLVYFYVIRKCLTTMGGINKLRGSMAEIA